MVKDHGFNVAIVDLFFLTSEKLTEFRRYFTITTFEVKKSNPEKSKQMAFDLVFLLYYEYFKNKLDLNKVEKQIDLYLDKLGFTEQEVFNDEAYNRMMEGGSVYTLNPVDITKDPYYENYINAYKNFNPENISRKSLFELASQATSNNI